LTSFKATSTGGNKGPVMELFEQKHKPHMDAEQAVLLALEGLRASLEESATLGQVEVLTLDRQKGSHRLTGEESQKYVARLPSMGGSGAKSPRN
ncbi:MAG: hypothetical protein L3J86_04890, partial [Thermoplasmata archaeon]|nr:hypothetical protein [Thermoplasmata archaeon]